MAYDKEKNMTQKYYNFEKLTPDKDADISVYEEAIEFDLIIRMLQILQFLELMVPVKAVL